MLLDYGASPCVKSDADLDTPLFLASNPFAGGYRLDGGRISVAHIPAGHGVTPLPAGPTGT